MARRRMRMMMMIRTGRKRTKRTRQTVEERLGMWILEQAKKLKGPSARQQAKKRDGREWGARTRQRGRRARRSRAAGLG
jgi:hypothetical protein